MKGRFYSHVFSAVYRLMVMGDGLPNRRILLQMGQTQDVSILCVNKAVDWIR